MDMEDTTSAWCNIILENKCTTGRMAKSFEQNGRCYCTQTAWRNQFSSSSIQWPVKIGCFAFAPIVVTGAGNGRGHLNFNQSNEFRSASAFIRAQLSWIINLDCCPSCSGEPALQSLCQTTVYSAERLKL